MQAAARLLERSNGDRFTVQEVADEAGQSLRTLYQYFESKDDLLLAVFEEAMRTYARMIGDGHRRPRRSRSSGSAARSSPRSAMPEFSDTGVDRGLARLRLQLSEVEPDLVARSQQPVTAGHARRSWPTPPRPAPSAPTTPRPRRTWSWR